jgi:tetratricopeptide (TPR) repeat protein
VWLPVRVLLVAAVGCSAPAPPPDLTRAQRYEHDGEDDRALAAYARAAVDCEETRDRTLRDTWCGAARLGKAETLERLGRLEEAAAEYEAVPAHVRTGDPPARALSAAAQLRLRLGQEVKAYDLYWKVITDFPDQPGADEALRHVVRDGRKRNARQLHDVLAALAERLAGTAIEDNLVFTLATLAREDLGDGKEALARYDDCAARFPEGALFDDSLWEGAAVARAAGDFEGALKRLRQLLATKERSFILGSYHSVYLDDALLLVGTIQRDDLHRAKEAARTFESLGREYPDSLLRDDALYQAGLARLQAGDQKGACRDFGRLVEKFPESRYVVDAEPDLLRQHGCEP